MLNLFTYFTEKTEESARAQAKLLRVQLMRTAIDYYGKIESAYEQITDEHKKEDLQALLNGFNQNIFTINTLSTSTAEMSQFLANASYQAMFNQIGNVEIQDNNETITIQDVLMRLSNKVAEEELNTKSHPRTIAKNQHLKIKYGSIYCASLSSLGIVGGIIVAAILTSATLYALGVPIGLFFLTQATYWMTNYQSYKMLGQQIKQDAFEPLLAEGRALHHTELPDTLVIKEGIKIRALREEQADPELISRDMDQFLDDIVDEGSYLLKETSNKMTETATQVTEQVTEAVNNLSAYAHSWSLNMWSIATETVSQYPAAKEHLHML
ncbi:MAG: hypothetical protein CK424_04630 [Legionella sp.]|nr:MAG: hypothetical protein CK424_04630 [Legionella sp.]